MERLRKMGIALVLWPSCCGAGFAAEDQVTAAASGFLQTISQGGESGCRGDLASRQDAFLAAGDGDLKPLTMILEAQRLQCESLRLGHEVERLAVEIERLAAEDARIEAIWMRDYAAAPKDAEDYPGRNRSQLLIRADQRAIQTTISALESTQDNLEAEALRVLLLAKDDLSRLTAEQREQLRIALDAGARHSIFDLFRQTLNDGETASS